MESVKVRNSNLKNVLNKGILECISQDIQQLERKLLPATIFGGFSLLALLPISATIGDALTYKKTGVMVGTAFILTSGFYFIKNVNKWFYEPLYKKYNISTQEYENFRMEKETRINSSEISEIL